MSISSGQQWWICVVWHGWGYVATLFLWVCNEVIVMTTKTCSLSNSVHICAPTHILNSHTYTHICIVCGDIACHMHSLSKGCVPWLCYACSRFCLSFLILILLISLLQCLYSEIRDSDTHIFTLTLLPFLDCCLVYFHTKVSINTYLLILRLFL